MSNRQLRLCRKEHMFIDASRILIVQGRVLAETDQELEQ